MAKCNLRWMTILAMLTVTMLTACSKDDLDVNPQETTDPYSDLYKNELLGRVKLVTRNEFTGTEWKNGGINKGNIARQYLTYYNETGYVTKEISKKIAKATPNTLLSESEATLTYDGKNRLTETVTVTYHRSPAIDNDEILYNVFQKLVITYDDHAKTATAILNEYNDKYASEYVPVKKWIYALNKDGKLDENNYEEGAISQASFDGGNSTKLVTAYDTNGNIAKQYKQTVENSQITAITNYVEIAYEYYQ